MALCCWVLVASPAAQAQSRCGANPWCDTSLPPHERARLVLGALTLDEKFALMSFHPTTGPDGWKAGDIPRLGIPPVRIADGPQGIRSTNGKTTALPAPIALASSFDERLARRYAALIAREAKQRGVDIVAAPTINIARTPLGGRTFESYGEDPFLMSRLGVAVVGGLQGEGIAAVAKHYLANNQETNRGTVNAVVDERTLREIYLPHYGAAVEEAGVASVMLAYNRTNGQHMTENRPLVNDLLKREWGFRGFTVSDAFTAVKDTARAANNGLDVELTETFYTPALLAAAVVTGQVNEATIDDHVLRVLREMFRFGMFDRAEFPRTGEIDVAAHAALAREAAEQGSVLLKNERGVLPLDASRLRSIAVIGPDADGYKFGGVSAAVFDPFYTVTPRQGIQQRAGAGVDVRYSRGVVPGEAAETARSADVAIVVASDSLLINEGLDKPCLSLQCPPEKGDQDALIEAVASANPNTIVVLETGTPVTMPWIDRVPAVLAAWYPGGEGGNAIARVLFGDADPGGRLPITFPAGEADLPTAGRPDRYPGVAENAKYSEGVFVGYRHYDEYGIEPLFPFGHGLSYTTFRFSRLRVARAPRGSANLVRATVDVRNTGRRTGWAVPQIYARLPSPSPELRQPPRQLKGFAKLRLRPGERRRVRFALDRRALSYWESSAGGWRLAPGCYRFFAGASSRDLPLRRQLRLRPRGAARPAGTCSGP